MKLLSYFTIAIGLFVLSGCQTKVETVYVPTAVFPAPPELLMKEPLELETIQDGTAEQDN